MKNTKCLYFKYKAKNTHQLKMKMKDLEITRLNEKQDSTISVFISVIYLLKSVRINRLK